jgi:hypothetical protein
VPSFEGEIGLRLVLPRLGRLEWVGDLEGREVEDLADMEAAVGLLDGAELTNGFGLGLVRVGV